MSPDQTILARKSLDRRLAPLRGEPLIAPPSGWIKAIREALGMTTRQLAARMGAARSRVTAIEKAEVNGSTTFCAIRRRRRPTLNSRVIITRCALKIRRWISAILPPSASDWFQICLPVHFAACGMTNERSIVR